MRNRRLPPVTAVLAILLLGLAAIPVLANFSTSGDPIATGPTDESISNAVGTVVCPDGSGGLICAYDIFSSADMRIQRLDQTGAPQWNGAAGVLVSANAGSSMGGKVIADGQGGAWVAWRDFGATDGVYVQRFSPSGAELLTPGGLLVDATTDVSSFTLDIDTTSTHELLVAWKDAGVRLQRVSLTGTLEWTAGGVLASTDDALFLDVAADPAGEGGVVTWIASRAIAAVNRQGVFANRVNAAGTLQWGANGVVAFHDAGFNTNNVRADWTGSDLFMAFVRQVNATGAITAPVLAQRLNASGAAQWGAGGVVVLNPPNTPFDRTDIPPTPRLVLDGAGGCFVGWVDARHFDQPAPNGFDHAQDIYGQRLNAAGAAQWTANGAPIDSLPGTQDDLEMAIDGAGGALFAYKDFFGLDMDISVVRTDAAGARVYKRGVSGSNNGDQDTPEIAETGDGGFVVAWRDERDGNLNNNIYGTRRVGSTGSPFVPSLVVNTPNGGEALRSLQPTNVTWAANFGGNVKLEYSVSGARSLITASTPNDGAFTWAPPAIASANVRLIVSDAEDGVPSDSSNAVFSVCTTLGNPTALATGAAPTGAVSGDFNSDSIGDLAVATSTGVTVHLGAGAAGVGSGSFGPGTATSLGVSCRDLAVGDANDDGITDLLVATPTGFTVLRGNGAAGVGNGTFTAGASFVAGTNPQGIAATDLDQDGVLDVVVANSSSNTVSVFLGMAASPGVGSGQFEPAVDYATGGNPGDVAFGDFNSDGRMDMAVANNNFASNSVSILLQNGAGRAGDGTFTTGTPVAAGNNPGAVVVGDFNEDGIADLAVANNGLGGVTVHIGNGAGGVGNATFAPRIVVPTFGLERDIAMGEFNGDGRADLLVCSSQDVVQIAFSNGIGTQGDGTFTVGGAFAVGADPTAILAIDQNEDGKPDVITCNQGSSTVSVALAGTCASSQGVAVLVLAPNGGEAVVVGNQRTITWARDTGVQAVDVLISRSAGSRPETLARGLHGTEFKWIAEEPVSNNAIVRIVDSNRPYSAASRDDSDALFTICRALSPASAIASAVGPRRVDKGDFDRDGIDDVLVLETGGFRVLYGGGAGGVGNGTFTAGSTVPVAGVADVEAVDITEDGILDVVSIGSDSASVWAGDGTRAAGAFSWRQRLSGMTGKDIELGDFDHDGILDLVTTGAASATTEALRLFFGEGANGQWSGVVTASPASSTITGTFGQLSLADVDRDGHIDAVLSQDTATPGMRVRRGIGTRASGGLQGSQISPAPPRATVFAISDFDGDGNPDVAVASDSSTFGLSVMRGNGDGTFGAAVKIDDTPGIRGIAAGVLTNQGRIDLVAAPGGTDSVLIYSRMGTGLVTSSSFRPHLIASVFTGGAESLLMMDSDEDDRPDLLIANRVGNNVLREDAACASYVADVALAIPNGGEAWQVGTVQAIQWSQENDTRAVHVELSRDGGATWERLASDLTNLGTFNWMVTRPATSAARVRIVDAIRSQRADTSALNVVLFDSPVDAPALPTPAAVALSPGWPNPSAGTIRFALELPDARPLRVEVFDMAGRRVRTLADGVLAAGRHSLAWDGHDERGGRAGAGMYYVRARGTGVDQTRAVVRLP